MNKWDENKHPRDNSGQFTSKGGASGTNAKPVEDDDLDFESWDKEDKTPKESKATETIVKNVYGKERKKEVLKSFNKFLGEMKDAKTKGVSFETFIDEEGWDDWMNAFIGDDEDTELTDEIEQDINNFAKELWNGAEEKPNNNVDSNRVDYIDTNKKYSAGEMYDIVTSDDKWDVSGGSDNVILKYKGTDTTYTWDRQSGKLEKTTEEEIQNKGKQKHQEEINDYVKDYVSRHKEEIKNLNDNDLAEKIYQASPYSIHSYDNFMKAVKNIKRG